jgi:hypothetical protein
MGTPVHNSSQTIYFGCYAQSSCTEREGARVCATNPDDDIDYSFEDPCGVPRDWAVVSCDGRNVIFATGGSGATGGNDGSQSGGSDPGGAGMGGENHLGGQGGSR